MAKIISTEVYSKVRSGFTGVLAFAFVLTLSAGFFSAALAQEEEVEYEYVYEEVEEDAPAVAAEPAPSVTKKRSGAGRTASSGKKISLGVQLGATSMLVGGYDINSKIKAELGLGFYKNGATEGNLIVLNTINLVAGGYYGIVSAANLKFRAGLDLLYNSSSVQTESTDLSNPAAPVVTRTTTSSSTIHLAPMTQLEYFLDPVFSITGKLGLTYLFSASEGAGETGTINTTSSAGFRWYVF